MNGHVRLGIHLRANPEAGLLKSLAAVFLRNCLDTGCQLKWDFYCLLTNFSVLAPNIFQGVILEKKRKMAGDRCSLMFNSPAFSIGFFWGGNSEMVPLLQTTLVDVCLLLEIGLIGISSCIYSWHSYEKNIFSDLLILHYVWASSFRKKYSSGLVEDLQSSGCNCNPEAGFEVYLVQHLRWLWQMVEKVWKHSSCCYQVLANNSSRQAMPHRSCLWLVFGLPLRGFQVLLE